MNKFYYKLFLLSFCLIGINGGIQATATEERVYIAGALSESSMHSIEGQLEYVEKRTPSSIRKQFDALRSDENAPPFHSIDLCSGERLYPFHITLKTEHKFSNIEAFRAEMATLKAALAKVRFEIDRCTYSTGSFVALILDPEYQESKSDSLTPEEKELLDLYIPKEGAIAMHISVYRWLDKNGAKRANDGSFITHDEAEITGDDRREQHITNISMGVQKILSKKIATSKKMALISKCLQDQIPKTLKLSEEDKFEIEGLDGIEGTVNFKDKSRLTAGKRKLYCELMAAVALDDITGFTAMLTKHFNQLTFPPITERTRRITGSIINVDEVAAICEAISKNIRSRAEPWLVEIGGVNVKPIIQK